MALASRRFFVVLCYRTESYKTNNGKNSMEIKKRERGERNGGKMKHGDVLLSYIEYLASLIKNTDETVVIQSDDRILEGFRYEKEVEDFQKAGIGLCLDDFGSGYANLNTVLKLPFSVVKMDRSLLTGVTCDEQTAVFYRSIVMVMQNMGYRIVAEGAETKEEVDLLQTWGVDMIQGYYFSRPLPENELLKLFDKE